MAAHYGTAVLPARPRRPRDKAKVEACVLIVERWLLGRLRDRRFYSLPELPRGRGERRASTLRSMAVTHDAIAAIGQISVVPLGNERIGLGDQHLGEHSADAFTCDFGQEDRR
jgi:hypothetical protein